MKFWIGVAVCILGAFFLITLLAGIGLGVSSSGTVSSPRVVDIGSGPYQTLAPTPVTRRLPADCVSIATPCGVAAAAAISDYVSRTHPASGAAPDFYYADYVEWPDSCLGVDTAGIVCLQVITPGFRVYLSNPAASTPQYLEYHTDLAGHAVFFATLGYPPDIPVSPLGVSPQ
jgi:hypothetical protein